MAVHAAVGHQADEMERRAVFQAVVHSAGKRLVFKKSRRLYGLCDAGQLLIDHAARADVRVSDFAVAHLPVRKAHVHAGGADCGIGIGGKMRSRFEGRRAHRVALFARIDAESVHDNQNQRLSHNKTPIITVGDRILTVLPPEIPNLLICRVHDRSEINGFKRSAADEAAVNIGALKAAPPRWRRSWSRRTGW